MLEGSRADRMRTRMAEGLMKHPQSVFFVSRIPSWIASTQRSVPDPAMWFWHVARVGGFGDAEIGALVSSGQGPGAAISAREIVAKKLLFSAPECADAADERIRDLAPLIRAKSRTLLGARADDSAVGAITQGRGPRPWMWCEPDDVALVGGRRWLLDYWAPGVVASEKIVRKQFSAQLHHSRLVAINSGIDIDGMALVQWDSLRWKPSIVEIPYDQSVDHQILRVGDSYWNEFVLKGVLPQPLLRNASPADRTAAISRITDQIVALRALASTAFWQAEKQSEVIVALSKDDKGRRSMHASLVLGEMELRAVDVVENAVQQMLGKQLANADAAPETYGLLLKA